MTSQFRSYSRRDVAFASSEMIRYPCRWGRGWRLYGTSGSYGGLLARAAIGGVLMGLANLVPGISGGTMLLAVGIYPLFIGAVADLSTFRMSRWNVALVGTVAIAAGLAILLLAGPVRDLVVQRRWLMYSLFIGLTLGGVPLVWRLARPVDASVWAGLVAGLALMSLMALGSGAGRGGTAASSALLGLAGLGGAAAMILPGISGGYLLLVLGQYEVILGAIDELKSGLLASSPDLGVGWAVAPVLLPVGIGVVIGVVVVSNGVRWLLAHHPKPTLGVLLGLLVGAVIGLWPFQEARPPTPGEELAGRVLGPDQAAAVHPEDWPLRRFSPSPGQILGSLAVMGLGLGVTLGISRLGPADPDPGAETPAR